MLRQSSSWTEPARIAPVSTLALHRNAAASLLSRQRQPDRPHACSRRSARRSSSTLVDRATAAHKSPAYLALNPNGLIPVLVDDDASGSAPLVLYETAAICLHLADTHPAAALAAAARHAPSAPQCYKWLAWCANTLQRGADRPTSIRERWADERRRRGGRQGATRRRRSARMLDQIDAAARAPRRAVVARRSRSASSIPTPSCSAAGRAASRARRASLPHVRPWLDRHARAAGAAARLRDREADRRPSV